VQVNQQQRILAIEKLQQVLKILKGKTIGLLGLTFKPETDDLRDAPAINLAEQLHRLGAKVKAFDPLYSQENITPLQAIPSTVTLARSLEALAQDCDALVLVTDWEAFRYLEFARLAQLMNTPVILDGRNCLDPDHVSAAGFYYLGMGRSSEPIIDLSPALSSRVPVSAPSIAESIHVA
jgi:UDPglucose 6-dehydrogenase